jgi:hypothetical protein
MAETRPGENDGVKPHSGRVTENHGTTYERLLFDRRPRRELENGSGWRSIAEVTIVVRQSIDPRARRNATVVAEPETSMTLQGNLFGDRAVLADPDLSHAPVEVGVLPIGEVWPILGRPSQEDEVVTEPGIVSHADVLRTGDLHANAECNVATKMPQATAPIAVARDIP